MLANITSELKPRMTALIQKSRLESDTLRKGTYTQMIFFIIYLSSSQQENVIVKETKMFILYLI